MNSEISKVIGKRINALLAKKFKRQKDLATALGVNDNTISYFVSGKRMPNTEQIIKISDFFGVSADYLLGLSDTPTADKDIQFICEYTGLDEKSVEVLQTIKNSKIPLKYITFNPPRIQSTMQILNKLISDGTLLSIVDLSMAFNNAFNLQEDYLVAAITALKEYKKEHIEKYVNDTDILEYQQYEKSKDNSELCLFKLQELVKDELKENISEQRERISKLNKEYKLLLKTHKLSDIFPDELNKDGENNVNNP